VDTTLVVPQIRAGDAVAVWLPSLNRDEAVFEVGDILVLGRRLNRQTTFGNVVYFCLGAAVARLVLRALLAELMTDGSEVTLAGQAYILTGLVSLPVTIRAA
jgi:cytochrome P450